MSTSSSCNSRACFLYISSARTCRLPGGGRGLARWLNDRMNRLGGATAGIGMFALALDTAQVFWLVCLFCFCQVLTGFVDFRWGHAQLHPLLANQPFDATTLVLKPRTEHRFQIPKSLQHAPPSLEPCVSCIFIRGLPRLHEFWLANINYRR